jgi:hypothetical protein
MNFDDNLALFSNLPRASQEKLRRMLDARERAHEALLAAWNRVNDERTELNRVKIVTENQRRAAGSRAGVSIVGSFDGVARRVPDTVDPAPHRGPVTDEDEDRFDQQLRLAQERVDRADAARKAAEDEFGKFQFLDQTIDWLKFYSERGGRLGHQTLPAVRLQRGENFRTAVDRVRAQIGACDTEWAHVDAAPMPLVELKAAIVQQVDRLAASGEPKILARDGVGGPTDLDTMIRARRANTADPTNLTTVLRVQRAGDLLMSDVSSPFVFWLDRDRIIERLHALAAAQDFTSALTDDQRDAALERLLDKRLELEFAEEALIIGAAEEGTIVARRRDADPRAILQVAEVFEEEGHDFHGLISHQDRTARGSAPVLAEGADK